MWLKSSLLLIASTTSQPYLNLPPTYQTPPSWEPSPSAYLTSTYPYTHTHSTEQVSLSVHPHIQDCTCPIPTPSTSTYLPLPSVRSYGSGVRYLTLDYHHPPMGNTAPPHRRRECPCTPFMGWDGSRMKILLIDPQPYSYSPTSTYGCPHHPALS
jgi:hypothetical protein